MEHIPVSGPWITQKEIEYVTDAVTHAWYDKANMYHERFEKAFSEYLGVPYAVTLPSCTSAIHLSLTALGIGPGDEVIVPDVTWIASVAPVCYVGAKPVFADIDSDTWCLSPESYKSLITARTKAVIPVDLYGNMPPMDEIVGISHERGIAVIEDAAEAIGSTYKSRKAGSFGDTGVFSFHGSKTLTTGEGGILVTSRKDIFNRVQILRDHGRRPEDKGFYNAEVAFKYKMSSMQAALGLAQLERIDELIARKLQIFSWYRNFLSDQTGVTLNYEGPNTRNTYWMVTVIIAPSYNLQKEELIRLMGERGISCRPFFYPLSSLPAFGESPDTRRAQTSNRNSYAISPYGINLPCGMNIDEEKARYICHSLIEILNERQIVR